MCAREKHLSRLDSCVDAQVYKRDFFGRLFRFVEHFFRSSFSELNMTVRKNIFSIVRSYAILLEIHSLKVILKCVYCVYL